MGLRLNPELERRCLELAGIAAASFLDPDISEKAFQSAVTDLAERWGWEWYHVYNSRKSKPGFPDTLFWRPPRHFVAELKTEDGVATDEQLEMLDRYRACGIPAFLWRPSSWTQIVEVLK